MSQESRLFRHQLTLCHDRKRDRAEDRTVPLRRSRALPATVTAAALRRPGSDFGAVSTTGTMTSEAAS
jgi:hypothetical protein